MKRNEERQRKQIYSYDLQSRIMKDLNSQQLILIEGLIGEKQSRQTEEYTFLKMLLRIIGIPFKLVKHLLLYSETFGLSSFPF